MKFIIKNIIASALIISILCICPCAFADSGSVQILSPIEGDRINARDVIAKIYLADSVTDAALYVDGELLRDIEIAADTNEYDIAIEPESLGSHELMLIAKGDGSIESDVVSFTVFGRIDETVKNYGFDSTSNIEYYIAQSLGGGVAGYTARTFTSETDGTNRWTAASFKEQDKGNNPMFIRYAGSEMLTGEVRLYIRIKAMQTNESFFVRLEGIGDITILDKSGKIGTTEEEYTADTWYDVNININTAVGTCETYVGDILADSRDVSDSGYKAVRLYMTGNNNDNASYKFDIFRIERTHYTPDVVKTVSVTSDAEDNEISAESDKIRIYFDSLPTSVNVGAENVKLFSDGAEIEIKEATANKENKYIDIVPESDLKENTKYRVQIDISAFYASGEYDIPFASEFKTASGGFAYESFGFESGDTPLLTSKFLKSGDKVSAKASFVNKTEADRTVVLVICAYEGDSITAISAKSEQIPCTASEAVTVETGEITYPGKEGSYVRASIINSWASPYALSAPIDLG